MSGEITIIHEWLRGKDLEGGDGYLLQGRIGYW
jgi:hypothetical protein